MPVGRWARPGTAFVLAPLHANCMGSSMAHASAGQSPRLAEGHRHPTLRIHLYRSPHTPPFVERLYQLARHIVEPVTYLPRPLQTIPEDVVDLSDFLYWPLLASEPMVDFFIRGLGISLDAVPAAAKANRWLSLVPVPSVQAPWLGGGYVLFCDQASTPLRTVPQEHAMTMVDRIWRQYGLPVLGF